MKDDMKFLVVVSFFSFFLGGGLLIVSLNDVELEGVDDALYDVVVGNVKLLHPHSVT